MTRRRDYQRSKVYDAEDEVGEGKRLDTVIEIQAWVDKITHSSWWNSRFPEIRNHTVVVKDGRGRRSGGALRGILESDIRIPRHFRTQKWILHELAHITVDELEHAWHGCEFAHNYLVLIQRWMGREYANELRSAFKRHRVHWYRRRQ